MGDKNENHFSYVFWFPSDTQNNTCVERGYEEWKLDPNWCITTFQGTKCSMM